jgi:hypothetical protein
MQNVQIRVATVLMAAFALVFFAACDETNQPGSSKINPAGNSSNTNKDSTSSTAPANDPFATHQINSSVRTIPPKPFRNHWTPTKPSATKNTELQVFLSRKGRRISIDKLRASIPYLFGGITWTDTANRNMFDRLALTLGRADYVALNKNNDDVTKMFMKLMDDMAMNVCKKAIAADLKLAEAQRKFIRFDKDINKTLRYVRLKFHAINVPQTSTDGIKNLRSLYDKAIAKKVSRQKAWELVCIATLTSPEFYVY